ncbi:MAG: DUF3750 domain-containing protein [Pseudomonadota bacterium]
MILGLLILFILPALAHVAVWQLGDHPGSWRTADWSSAGILPTELPADSAEIMVLSARTGGLKGSLSVHSWLVLKVPGETRYRRYDVVGWGPALRRDNYAPDGKWYSNLPSIRHKVEGLNAAASLPTLLAAIESYEYGGRGDYTIWPGPNSNSFVAHALRAVPELGFTTSPLGVGRDFAPGPLFDFGAHGIRASLWGYAGFALSERVGLELNFLGLVTGLNPLSGKLVLPGFGEIRLWRAAPHLQHDEHDGTASTPSG